MDRSEMSSLNNFNIYGSGGLKPTSVRASLTVVLFAQN